LTNIAIDHTWANQNNVDLTPIKSSKSELALLIVFTASRKLSFGALWYGGEGTGQIKENQTGTGN
jgi:hypothetical protein